MRTTSLVLLLAYTTCLLTACGGPNLEASRLAMGVAVLKTRSEMALEPAKVVWSGAGSSVGSYKDMNFVRKEYQAQYEKLVFWSDRWDKKGSSLYGHCWGYILVNGDGKEILIVQLGYTDVRGFEYDIVDRWDEIMKP